MSKHVLSVFSTHVRKQRQYFPKQKQKDHWKRILFLSNRRKTTKKKNGRATQTKQRNLQINWADVAEKGQKWMKIEYFRPIK